jgi:ABC-type phosphate/phosphonate transport system permease subunit
MHADLRLFLYRLVGTIMLALAAVVFTAFVSMPLSLNRHPGDVIQADVPPKHMT